MSPRARRVAIATLEDELDRAREWRRQADENLEQATAMLETARHGAQAAAERVRDLSDALADMDDPVSREMGAWDRAEADGTSTDA